VETGVSDGFAGARRIAERGRRHLADPPLKRAIAWGACTRRRGILKMSRLTT
jgi:hypothetical protein